MNRHNLLLYNIQMLLLVNTDMKPNIDSLMSLVRETNNEIMSISVESKDQQLKLNQRKEILKHMKIMPASQGAKYLDKYVQVGNMTKPIQFWKLDNMRDIFQIAVAKLNLSKIKPEFP